MRLAQNYNKVRVSSVLSTHSVGMKEIPSSANRGCAVIKCPQVQHQTVISNQFSPSDGRFSASTHSLSPHSASIKAVAHWQMRTTTQSAELPFTYRTFGVSGAQPQSHYSQHAGYSQHLLGGGFSSRGGRRATTATSLLFLSFPLSLSSSPPSPPLLFNASGSLLSLFRQSVETVHWCNVGQAW